MIDITAKDVVKSFEKDKNIIDKVTFKIDSGERVGLLGKNGVGKTTLFKCITGEYSLNSGDIFIASGKRVGVINQIPRFPQGYTVDMVLRTAFEQLDDIKRQIDRIAVQMETDYDEKLLARYGELTDRFERMGGYDTETALNKVTNGLSIPLSMRSQPFDSLSGGEKTRINLARLILTDTDILLLDEPTNHLDMQATLWLEEYIRTFHGSVIIISHDRYFLDRTVTRIMELVNGKLEFYSGNYSFYAIEKERRYQEKLARYEKRQAKIERLEKSAEPLRMFAFKGMDKTYRRAVSMERRIARMKTVEKPVKRRKLDARFDSVEFHGDDAVQIKRLSKSFGDRQLFAGINLRVGGGERIGLIGENGTGKTTFLNMLTGREGKDDGIIKIGPSIKWAYLEQNATFSDPWRNLVETLVYECDMSESTARNRLAAYQFQGDDVFKAVAMLSGGELARLRLCMLMDESINMLILDEPTNHLDIDSREWIEEAVEAYDGTLIFVSHDRYFINRFATRIWELQDGTIHDYPMGFAQYQKMKEEERASKPAPISAKEEKAPKPEKNKNNMQALKRKLTIAENNIEKLENEISYTDVEMLENGSDVGKLSELYNKKQRLEKDLRLEAQLWEELMFAIEEAELGGK